jgi:hypothetical protein
MVAKMKRTYHAAGAAVNCAAEAAASKAGRSRA